MLLPQSRPVVVFARNDEVPRVVKRETHQRRLKFWFFSRKGLHRSNPDFLLGAARPLPPNADIGPEGSPLVKLRNSA